MKILFLIVKAHGNIPLTIFKAVDFYYFETHLPQFPAYMGIYEKMCFIWTQEYIFAAVSKTTSAVQTCSCCAQVAGCQETVGYTKIPLHRSI